MTDPMKEARAEAKAAAAKAKALRPFWKKKRSWLIAGVAVLAIAGIASAAGNSGKSSDSSSSELRTSSVTQQNTEAADSPSDTVRQGYGTKDATGDVVSISCGNTDSLGLTYPKVVIKNNSSKPSTYFVTLVAESQDGSMRYDDTIGTVDALEPGQSFELELLPFTKELPPKFRCRITELQRTAS